MYFVCTDKYADFLMSYTDNDLAAIRFSIINPDVEFNINIIDLISIFEDVYPDICNIIITHKLPHCIIKCSEIQHDMTSLYLTINEDQIPFAILCGLFFRKDIMIETFGVMMYRHFLFEER